MSDTKMKTEAKQPTQPKKRHGNRKPVVPVYSKPNSVAMFNAAMRLANTDHDTPEWDKAYANLMRQVNRMDNATASMVEAINVLDNMIP